MSGCCHLPRFALSLDESSLLPPPLAGPEPLLVQEISPPPSSPCPGHGRLWTRRELPGARPQERSKIVLRALSFQLFGIPTSLFNKGDFPLFLSPQAVSHPVATPDKRACHRALDSQLHGRQREHRSASLSSPWGAPSSSTQMCGQHRFLLLWLRKKKSRRNNSRDSRARLGFPPAEDGEHGG